jgi:hypothetical protein
MSSGIMPSTLVYMNTNISVELAASSFRIKAETTGSSKTIYETT